MKRGACTLLAAALLTLPAALGVGAVPAQADAAALGDAAWQRRADGARDGAAAAGPILEALDAYERALAERPGSLTASWKLLRALHFAGEFTERPAAEKARSFARARTVAEAALDRLARRLPGAERLEALAPEEYGVRLDAAGVARSEVARLYFWSAINWGAWSQRVGLLEAVRRGAANRVHAYTRVARVLEPGYEEGGALRLEGRLHAELPRVPFVTAWVDRERALPLLERAHALAPEHPGNQLLLGITLLELAPERRAEGLSLLRQAQSLTPRADMLVEDLAIRDLARRELAAYPSR